MCKLSTNKEEEICVVIGLTKEGIQNQTFCFCPYAVSNPISLTPEWLERIIFKICAVTQQMREYYYVDWAGRMVGNPIRTLHVLQNFHFYYSGGEELQIKMP